MSEAQISLSHICKVFPLGDVEVRALDDLSLEIGRGEFVAIMGSSGSGKSTLMNILGCLDTPTSGSYRFEGMSVEALNRKQLADLRNTASTMSRTNSPAGSSSASLSPERWSPIRQLSLPMNRPVISTVARPWKFWPCFRS